MIPQILTTKLFVPHLRTDLLSRPSLLNKLDESVAYTLTLLSASAGSGKTTLLSEWTAGNNRPTAWISLDGGDNDPARLLAYLISALRTIREEFGQEALEILQSTQTVLFETILVDLINEIAEFPKGFTLILDDYHEITDQRTNELMVFLVDHLPPQMHLAIASRIDPPWPLARYRARNQLFEIRGQDLRFSAQEVAGFLKRTMGLDLTIEDVEALEARTEGWVAGLQLAAIAWQSQVSTPGYGNLPGFIKAFTGSHLYVAEYLMEEILKHQPKDIQAFLLRTSILERFNADLCEAVSGCQNVRSILTTLHRTNVFVVSLDNKGQWFRYHHLFADLLRSRLPQALTAEGIPELHRRASAWYEQHGFTLEAVDHALAAKDFERVAELVKRSAPALISLGQIKTLGDWLQVLPQASFQAYPQLTFYQFWIDVLYNRADLSEGAIQEKEDLLKGLASTPENDRLRGELMAVVCRAVALSGRTSEGIRLAQEALAYLPADGLAAQARALSALAAAHDLDGRAGRAEPIYQESIAQALAVGDFRLAAHTLMVQGLVQIHYGRLREAAETFQAIVDMAPAPAGVDSTRDARKTFFPAGQGYIGLGCIHLEWCDLDAAESYLERGMDLCRQGGLDGIFIGRVRTSRLRQARGDLTGALEEILIPQPIQRADNFNLVTRQIQIALAEGDVDRAGRLAAPLVEMLDRDPDSIQMPLLFLEILEVVVARVYLARGELEKTLQVLDRLEASAGPAERAGRLIQVYLLRALAYQKQHGGVPIPAAMECFERALALGEPAGYALLFLEEGPEVMTLLSAVIDHSVVSAGVRAYACRLLGLFGGIGEPTALPPTGEAPGLVEPLTPREMQVLELLASGDSNQAIADKLVITVRTVKKHTSNIYGKLNASNRTQAVALAREFGLLSTD